MDGAMQFSISVSSWKDRVRKTRIKRERHASRKTDYKSQGERQKFGEKETHQQKDRDKDRKETHLQKDRDKDRKRDLSVGEQRQRQSKKDKDIEKK